MMLNIAGSLLLLAFAGALLAAAVAKAAAVRSGSLSWPDPSLAGVRIPVGVVIVVEGAAASAVLLLRAPPAAAVLAVTYGALSGAAWRLRGRTCGCFGSRSSVVGPGHIAGTVAACGVSTALTPFLEWGLPLPARALALAAITTAVLLNARRTDLPSGHEHVTDRAEEPGSLDKASAIMVLTSAHCPHCAALRVMLDGRLSDHAIRWTDLDQAPAYQKLTEGRVPCAVAVDDGGRLVSEPRWGTQDIPPLVDSFLTASEPARP